MRMLLLALSIVGLAVIGGWLWLSDGISAGEHKDDTMTNKVAIVGVRGGSPGEPTFEQRYDVKLKLPMEEQEFLGLVHRLNLPFYAEGPAELNLENAEEGYYVPTPPVHTTNYDMTNISHSYFVYEEADPRARRQVKYLVLVRKDRMVVFIENYFSYRVF